MTMPGQDRTLGRIAHVVLLGLAVLGALAYGLQCRDGLGVTGLSR